MRWLGFFVEKLTELKKLYEDGAIRVPHKTVEMMVSKKLFCWYKNLVLRYFCDCVDEGIVISVFIAFNTSDFLL